MCDNVINIVSWNIESITEGKTKVLKTEESSFLKLLNGNHIVCLQETIKPVTIPGYKSYCNIRKGKSINHGGVCTLVRNDLVSGITRIGNITDSSDIIIIKCSKNILKMHKDLYVINVYMSPKNSSYALKGTYAPFEELARILDSLAKRGDCELAVMGDFNARIGQYDDFMKDDKFSSFVDIPSEVNNSVTYNKRNSKDTHTNSYKNDLLDLVIGYKMIILNGRTIGDLYGDYTCVKWNGCSLIDYGIISSNLIRSVTSFKVLNFTEFSDHKPIKLSIRSNISSLLTPKICLQKPIFCPKRFIMSDEGKINFKETQKTDIYKERINNLLNSYHDDSDVSDFNDYLTHTIVNLADSSFKSTKPWRIKDDQRHDKPWYDHSCRESKKVLNKATRIVDAFPNSDFIRKRYYTVKKGHFRLLQKKRNKHMCELNRKIESGKVIDWKSFKKLRTSCDTQHRFDSDDIDNFQSFFSRLYSDNHETLNAAQKDKLLDDATQMNEGAVSPDSEEILNGEITSDEINRSISQLKTGKSSSDDLVLNDMLKLLSNESKRAIKSLFNLSLNKGVYPWHNSIVTPLHKKGDRKDPDNYRAIAVGSCLGKLFSNILLERIVHYKQLNCPDPPNQMGFTKNAQTIDHIFTIKTIIEKYKKIKKKIYCVFVDLKKAFDTVPRQALLFKLAYMGIRGKIFDVIRDMYSSSTIQLKLGNKLSEKINIRKGTEQGHTLSPEFFKCYLDDLSPLLDHPNVPELNNTLISHLLWADDLVLMGLDLETAQHLFDTFSTFCNNWGLEINIKKSGLVIFNKKSLKNNNEFITMGRSQLDTVESYTYLGLNLHMSGSLNYAVSDLYNKALRALNALKRYLDRSVISFKAMIKLFDTLIKPILSYGAAIWTPYLNVSKTIIDFADKTGDEELNQTSANAHKIHATLHRKFSSQVSEKIHLKYIKWILGVHKYASNTACWNEVGRPPLLGGFMKQTLVYLDRIKELPDELLVKKAWLEQKELKLPWFTATHGMARYSGDEQADKKFRETFSQTWKCHLQNQTKLDFYSSLNSNFNITCEEYLMSVKNFQHRSTLTKIRTSAHRLAIETGRYLRQDREDRVCVLCDSGAVEDETHFLMSCRVFDEERALLFDGLAGAGVTSSSIDPHMLLCHPASGAVLGMDGDDATRNELFRSSSKYISLMYNKRKTIIDDS